MRLQGHPASLCPLPRDAGSHPGLPRAQSWGAQQDPLPSPGMGCRWVCGGGAGQGVPRAVEPDLGLTLTGGWLGGLLSLRGAGCPSVVPSAWHSLGAFPPHRVGGVPHSPPCPGTWLGNHLPAWHPLPAAGDPAPASPDGWQGWSRRHGSEPSPWHARQSRGQMGKRCTGAARCCRVPAHPDAGTLGWPSTRARLQKGLSPVCVVLWAEPSYVLAGLGVLGHGPTALSHWVSAAGREPLAGSGNAGALAMHLPTAWRRAGRECRPAGHGAASSTSSAGT